MGWVVGFPRFLSLYVSRLLSLPCSLLHYILHHPPSNVFSELTVPPLRCPAASYLVSNTSWSIAFSPFPLGSLRQQERSDTCNRSLKPLRCLRDRVTK